MSVLNDLHLSLQLQHTRQWVVVVSSKAILLAHVFLALLRFVQRFNSSLSRAHSPSGGCLRCKRLAKLRTGSRQGRHGGC